MGLDYFDIFYLHRPALATPLEESLGALDLLVRQGKVFYAGVSNFPGAPFAEAVRACKERGWAPITIHQPSNSLVNCGIERDLLPEIERAGTGVITLSPLASGVLSDKYLGDTIPDDSRAALAWDEAGTARRLSLERLATLRALNDLAQERGQTLSPMALAWVLRFPAVTSALIGASRVSQIEENVRALDHADFSAEELAMIDRLTDTAART